MPYICTSDHTKSFQTSEALIAAQAEAMASGDLRQINTLFDIAWIDEPVEK